MKVTINELRFMSLPLTSDENCSMHVPSTPRAQLYISSFIWGLKNYYDYIANLLSLIVSTRLPYSRGHLNSKLVQPCVRIIGLALQHVPNNSLAEVKTKVALQLVFRLIIVNKYMILHWRIIQSFYQKFHRGSTEPKPLFPGSRHLILQQILGSDWLFYWLFSLDGWSRR